MRRGLVLAVPVLVVVPAVQLANVSAHVEEDVPLVETHQGINA